MVLIGVRKCLSYIFSEEELKILDDVLPSFKRTQQLDIEDKQKRPIALAFAVSDFVSLRVNQGGEVELPMANGKVMKIPVDDLETEGG